MPKNFAPDGASVFATRLTELRKEKKISQKQAAADLGISQALLSHYENGVRECGLNFVVKAANYYNTSCDFLLGNSKSTVSLNREVSIHDIPEDEELTADTVVRAALVLGSKIKKDEELYNYTVSVYGLSTYLVLYAGIKKGIIPKSWIAENLLNPETASFISHRIGDMTRDVRMIQKKTAKEKEPLCIKTVGSWTNDYLNISVAGLL